MSYAKINTATNELLEVVEEVPAEIFGLAQETLDDLNEIAGSLPEYTDIGYWPVTISYEAETERTEVLPESKSVIQYVTEAKEVPLAIHVIVPQAGTGTPEELDAPAPETAITCIGNVFTKMMHFVNAGDVMAGHRHAYDHPTLLAKGSLEVDYQGIKSVFVAPTVIYIKANTLHQLMALEDDTVAFCIHPLRDADNPGELLDASNIPQGVNPLNHAAPLLNSESP